jgi:hypothetical protein
VACGPDECTLAAVAQNLRKLIKLIGFSPPLLSSARHQHEERLDTREALEGSIQLTRIRRMTRQFRAAFPRLS